MYHHGHRERFRQRYIDSGLDGFNDHEIVELILTYAIPRRDVNLLAHQLVGQFGGLAGVLEADVKELSAVEGIGARSAVLIRLFNDVGRIYQLRKSGDRVLLNTTQALGQYCVTLAYGRAYEMLNMVCLNAQKKLINTVMVEEGTPGEIQIQARKLIEIAIRNKADSVVLTHNHPGGTAMPSHSDISTTRVIMESFRAVGISLVDHIVVADQRFVSMYELGYMKF